jgi:flavin reductase (DIM6/NTAB) family NADH-FMN oxidoreductase RutF
MANKINRRQINMSVDPVKDVLRMMPYGFYSITTRYEDNVNAMVANWITQASFEPQLIALAIQKDCYSRGLIDNGNVFAVNLFQKVDVEFIKPYTKSRAKNPAKMDGSIYSPGPETGCPILEGAAAYLECKVVAIHNDGGDHDIVIGEVVGAGVIKAGDVNETLTLIDLGWSYAG